MDGAGSTIDPDRTPGADFAPGVTSATRPPIGKPATALIAIGGVIVGIPVTNLREVMVHPPDLQPLPSGGPFCLGCVPLRGQVIPVLDLSTTLNLPMSEEGACIIVILRWENRVVGIRAQEVRRIVQSRDLLIQELIPAGSEMACLVLPTIALVGEDVVSLLDAGALFNSPNVPHTAEHQTRSRHLDRSSQFLLCEVGGWRYCVSVRHIEATLADTAVDSSVVFHGACEGVVERHGLKMALINPRVYSGFSSSAERPQHSSGIVLKLDADRCLTLRADRITDILHLQRTQFTAIPAAQCDRPDLFLGVVLDARGLPFYVLDVERLVAEPDVQALAGITHRGVGVGTAGSLTCVDPKGVPGTAIFVRAGGLRALPIHDVEEIVPRPVALKGALPRHDGFLGSIPYRDALLPVFCMSWLSGMPDAPAGHRPGIAVVRNASERIGLLVQDIVGIERVQFVDDVPAIPGGPITRLAMRNTNTTNRLVAVWQLVPSEGKEVT